MQMTQKKFDIFLLSILQTAQQTAGHDLLSSSHETRRRARSRALPQGITMGAKPFLCIKMQPRDLCKPQPRLAELVAQEPVIIDRYRQADETETETEWGQELRIIT